MYALRLHQTEPGGGLLLVIPFDQVLDAAVGIQQAAQAAASGDPAALMAMMDRLMHTREGAELVDRIGAQAKRAGLE